MEIFLLHLLDQEEGERLGDPSADGMHGLQANVNSKSLVSLVVFLPRICGKPFDTVGT